MRNYIHHPALLNDNDDTDDTDTLTMPERDTETGTCNADNFALSLDTLTE